MKIGLVLLNFNEIDALPTFLANLQTEGFYSIFAVDGGSTDGSKELLLSNGFDVISQKARGRGDAFKIAFSNASTLSLDSLVFISTDGNESSKDLPQMMDALVRGYDLVIGSRMIDGARNEEDDQIFRPRKFANKIFAQIAYLRFASGMPKITDPINGYRAITMNAWDRIGLDFNGYDVEYAMSIQAYRHRLKVYEFPTIEMDRIGGKSGAKAIPTSIALLKVLWRLRKKI